MKFREPDIAAEALERLRGFAAIEAVDQVFAGENVRDDSFDIGAIIVLRNEDAFARYLRDPIHLELDRFSRPYATAASVFDLAEGEPPDIGRRLAALSDARESDPELAFSEITPFEIER